MDAEHRLEKGPWSATVSPYGASLRSVRHGGRDLLWGYSGTASKRGGQGDVLIPWPGRIKDAEYAFQGTRQKLPANDKDGPNAIHGFLRVRTWDEGPRTASSAQFRTRITRDDHPGYPFDLDIGLGYELDGSGLACAFVVHNRGDGPAPFGAGFHPYVFVPADAARLEVPASRVLEFDGLLPTGRVVALPPELDFRSPRVLDATRLNHCFTDLRRDTDGFARVHVDDVVVWMDASFPYLVLYTGDALGVDARRSIAVEPMTCGTDAFNHPDWGLRVLRPGETFQGTWGVGLSQRSPSR